MSKIPRFPEETELKDIRRRLSRGPASRPLPRDASPLQRAKYQLCEAFVDYCLKHRMSQRELAERLGTNESRVSEIVHYKIDRLTLDRLVKYHGKLNPKFTLKVA
jgi:predicted XRE-type DNA-binding protein